MSKESSRLRSLFDKKLDRWSEEKMEEHWYLTMKLVNWACQPVSIRDRKFWDMVEAQIRFKAEKLGISPKKAIEYLFDQTNSETWMSRFK